MQNFFERFQALPKDLQKEVIDFAERLEKKRKEKQQKDSNKKFDFSGWEGALSDMKEEYTSVELQKKAMDWR